MSFTTLSGFRALYEAEYGFVWSTVRRLGVPTTLLEDAVQDTFIVAYRRRDVFAPGPARPWLYGIARGVASNYRRTARRVTRKREALASVLNRTPQGGAQVSLQALSRFLDSLSHEDRELFVLSEVEGLTGPELSSALQLGTRTVYRRLARLRVRLAEEAIEEGALRPRRPRASAARWAALLPSIRAARLGWLGVAAAKIGVAAAGFIGVASVGWLVASRETPDLASPEVAGSIMAPKAPAPPDFPPVVDPVPAAAQPEPAPPTRRRPAAPQTQSADLSRENALLRQASDATTRGDFADALSATRQHAAEFPASALSDLRTALRVEALCGAGNTAQGRGEAKAFIADSPDAPLVERIRRACWTKPAATGRARPRRPIDSPFE